MQYGVYVSGIVLFFHLFRFVESKTSNYRRTYYLWVSISFGTDQVPYHKYHQIRLISIFRTSIAQTKMQGHCSGRDSANCPMQFFMQIRLLVDKSETFCSFDSDWPSLFGVTLNSKLRCNHKLRGPSKTSRRARGFYHFYFTVNSSTWKGKYVRYFSSQRIQELQTHFRLGSVSLTQ